MRLIRTLGITVLLAALASVPLSGCSKKEEPADTSDDQTIATEAVTKPTDLSGWVVAPEQPVGGVLGEFSNCAGWAEATQRYNMSASAQSQTLTSNGAEIRSDVALFPTSTDAKNALAFMNSAEVRQCLKDYFNNFAQKYAEAGYTIVVEGKVATKDEIPKFADQYIPYRFTVDLVPTDAQAARKQAVTVDVIVERKGRSVAVFFITGPGATPAQGDRVDAMTRVLNRLPD